MTLHVQIHANDLIAVISRNPETNIIPSDNNSTCDCQDEPL